MTEKETITTFETTTTNTDVKDGVKTTEITTTTTSSVCSLVQSDQQPKSFLKLLKEKSKFQICFPSSKAPSIQLTQAESFKILKLAGIDSAIIQNYFTFSLTTHERQEHTSTSTRFVNQTYELLFNYILVYNFQIQNGNHVEISKMSFYKIIKMLDKDIFQMLDHITLQILEFTYNEITTRSNFHSKLNNKSNAMQMNKAISFFEKQEDITIQKSFDYERKWKKMSMNGLEYNLKNALDYITTIRQKINMKKENVLSYICPYNTFVKIRVCGDVHYIRKEILSQWKAKYEKSQNKEETVTVKDIKGKTVNIEMKNVDTYLEAKSGEFSYIQTEKDRRTPILIPPKDLEKEFQGWKTLNSIKPFVNEYNNSKVQLPLKDVEIPELERVEISLSELEKTKVIEAENKKILKDKKFGMFSRITNRSLLIETNEKKLIAYKAFQNILNSNETSDIFYTKEYLTGKEDKVSRQLNENLIINSTNEYVDISVKGKYYIVKKVELIEAIKKLEKDLEEMTLLNYLDGKAFNVTVNVIEINPYKSGDIKVEKTGDSTTNKNINLGGKRLSRSNN